MLPFSATPRPGPSRSRPAPAPGRPPRARTPAYDLPRPAGGREAAPLRALFSSKGEVRRARRLKPSGVGRLSTQAEIERASANRRIAQPRSATATLIIERRSQHFPDPARGPLKTGRPRRAPTDYPAPRGDCSYIDKAMPAHSSGLTSAFLPLRLVY